jgi:hypothetical protein
MAPRKKKGIAFLVSGLLFVAAGVTTLWFGDAAEWLAGALPTIGAIAEAIGFELVYPDVND